MLDTAAETGPGPALLVADVLDAVSAAVLAAAGLNDPGAARAVLASLWAHDGGGITEVRTD
jgi:hypothetical protein